MGNFLQIASITITPHKMSSCVKTGKSLFPLLCLNWKFHILEMFFRLLLTCPFVVLRLESFVIKSVSTSGGYRTEQRRNLWNDKWSGRRKADATTYPIHSHSRNTNWNKGFVTRSVACSCSTTLWRLCRDGACDTRQWWTAQMQVAKLCCRLGGSGRLDWQPWRGLFPC